MGVQCVCNFTDVVKANYPVNLKLLNKWYLVLILIYSLSVHYVPGLGQIVQTFYCLFDYSLFTLSEPLYIFFLLVLFYLV